MENMKLEGYEPVVYIKEECTNISALNPIDLNIQDEEDVFGDKSEHKVYCSLTVVNPEEITCDSVGSEDYNSDWVFGLQSNNNNTTSAGAVATDGVVNQLPPHTHSSKNNEPIQPVVECELSNDSTFSLLNDNSSSDNSNMYIYYTLPNDSSLVNLSSHHEAAHKRVDFKDWNTVVVSEEKKVIVGGRAEKSPPVKKTFPCPICNKVFASKSNLERHGVVHSDVKPFKCLECNRMFSRRVHLERHKFLHMDQKPFNCDVCKKGFTQKTHLEKHKIVHSPIKPFECTKCAKSFARKESLNRHRQVHAANEIKEAAAAAAAAAAATANANANANAAATQNPTAKRKEITLEKNNSPEKKDNTSKKNNSVILKTPDKVQHRNQVKSEIDETKCVSENLSNSEVVV